MARTLAWLYRLTPLSLGSKLDMTSDNKVLKFSKTRPTNLGNVSDELHQFLLANSHQDPTNYANISIPDNWQSYFSHLFEREKHVNILYSTLKIAIDSNWKYRFHVLLYGPPGCGKSDICLSLKEMLGHDSVLEFDATTTTAAGAIREMNTRPTLPRILLVEEIEKADKDSLRWLIGLLDIHGEINKVTYNEHIRKDAKMLCIATVNDIDMFRAVLYGSLSSRFPHQLYCPRPERSLLGKILEREI